MSNLFWLTRAQMARLAPFFLKSHGKSRADDKRGLSENLYQWQWFAQAGCAAGVWPSQNALQPLEALELKGHLRAG